MGAQVFPFGKTWGGRSPHIPSPKPTPKPKNGGFGGYAPKWGGMGGEATHIPSPTPQDGGTPSPRDAPPTGGRKHSLTGKLGGYAPK